MIVKKEPQEQFNFAGDWHSDATYRELTALGSILYAVEVPSFRLSGSRGLGTGTSTSFLIARGGFAEFL